MSITQIGNVILGISVIAIVIIFTIASMIIINSLNLDCPNTTSSKEIIQAVKRLCDSSTYLFVTIPTIAIAYFFLRIITLQTKGN